MTVLNPSDLLADRAPEGLTLLICHPGIDMEIMAFAFATEAIRRGEPCVYFSTRLPAARVREALREMGIAGSGLEIVDGYSWRAGLGTKGGAELKGLHDLNAVSRALKAATPERGPYTMIIDSFSDLLLQREAEPCIMLYKEVIAFLRNGGGRGLCMVTHGAHPEWVEVNLRAWADAALEVKIHERGSQLEKVIRVAQARGERFDPAWNIFELTPRGVMVQTDVRLPAEVEADVIQSFQYLTPDEAVEKLETRLTLGSDLTAMIGPEGRRGRAVAVEVVRDALKRGASVKVMNHIDESNLPLVKAALRAGIPLRHLEHRPPHSIVLLDDIAIEFLELGQTVTCTSHKPTLERVRSHLEAAWSRAVKAEIRIIELEKGVAPPTSKVFRDGEEAQRFLKECVDSAKHSVFFATTEMGAERVFRGHSYKSLWDRGVKLRGIASITEGNIDSARHLSRYIQLRHLATSTIRLVIVDNEKVFMLPVTSDKLEPEIGFQNLFYSDEEPYLIAFMKLAENLWRSGIPAKRWFRVVEAKREIDLTKNLTQLYNVLARSACELTNSRFGMVKPYNRQLDSFSTPVLYTPPSSGVRDDLKSETTHRALHDIYREILKGVSVRLADVTQHPGFKGPPSDHPSINSILAVPLKNPALEIIGLLAAGNKLKGRHFSARDEEILSYLVHEASPRLQLFIDDVQQYFPGQNPVNINLIQRTYQEPSETSGELEPMFKNASKSTVSRELKEYMEKIKTET